MTEPTRKRLLIKCPQVIREAHSVPDERFETVSSVLYLSLFVGRGKYTPTCDTDENAYIDSFNTEVAPIHNARCGFEAVIEYADMEVQRLVEHLRYNCLSADKKTHTPIVILDFVSPHWNDIQTLNGEYYTARSGRIISIQGSGASIGFNSVMYSDGFTIRFKERQNRILG